MSNILPLLVGEWSRQSSKDETKMLKRSRRKQAITWCTTSTIAALVLSIFTIMKLHWDHELMMISVFEIIVYISAAFACICGCLRDDPYLIIPHILIAVLVIIIRFIVFILALIAAVFPQSYNELLRSRNHHNGYPNDIKQC
ncbi:unnamed protein product [Anisakis simplex]|uniref:Inner membrane protein n=1 Tax=Anisakis simplex TaxID=6269 RepID=A0A0M3K3R1_ANISI|nr:unnamed protein product [Anisakis simplex]